MEMADRVAVMERGRIVQFDAPQALLEAPATAFVAGFLGEATRLPVRIRDGSVQAAEFGMDDLRVDLPDGDAELFLRPHEVQVEPARGGLAQGVVRFVRPEGAGGARILAEIGGRMIEGLRGASGSHLARGDACTLHAVAGTVFHSDGGRFRWQRREAEVPQTAR